MCSLLQDDTLLAGDDASAPDGGQPSAASRNIVSERNRRKKLNDRLLALRAIVPNITKVHNLILHAYLHVDISENRNPQKYETEYFTKLNFCQNL